MKPKDLSVPLLERSSSLITPNFMMRFFTPFGVFITNSIFQVLGNTAVTSLG